MAIITFNEEYINLMKNLLQHDISLTYQRKIWTQHYDVKGNWKNILKTYLYLQHVINTQLELLEIEDNSVELQFLLRYKDNGNDWMISESKDIVYLPSSEFKRIKDNAALYENIFTVREEYISEIEISEIDKNTQLIRLQIGNEEEDDDEDDDEEDEEDED